MALHFRIERSGNDFSCRVDDGAPFFVGRRVPYKARIGLYNVFGKSPLAKLDYAPETDGAGLGFWAQFILPTARCEGLNFLTLNTYDRAAFTFGFGQFAAHVPNGDFVRYFRALLGQKEAAAYFPGLQMVKGRIVSDKRGPLETDASTEPLMTYLNPTTEEVEDAEVISAAKFIHWTTTSAAARGAQVTQMVETFRAIMREADKRVGIDGRSAAECCLIADLRHQGRAGKMLWPEVNESLKSAKPFDKLLAIGTAEWDGRRATLRKAIGQNPAFADLRWSRAKADFV